jgi:hypothetical protein
MPQIAKRKTTVKRNRNKKNMLLPMLNYTSPRINYGFGIMSVKICRN